MNQEAEYFKESIIENHQNDNEAAVEDVYFESDEIIPNAQVIAASPSHPLFTGLKVEGDIPDPVFLHDPTYFICPNCNYEGMTQVRRAKGALFTFCFWLPVCWTCECCDDYEHICPLCRVVLGSYNEF